jgi:hypothetical protein
MGGVIATSGSQPNQGVTIMQNVEVLPDGIVFPTDDMSQVERINEYRKLISHYSDLQSDATKDMLLELEA